MFLDKHRVLNPNKMDDNKSQGGHTTEATISRDKIDFWHQVWLSSNLNLDIQRYRAQNQIQRVHLDRSKNTTPCHLFAYCKMDNSSSSSSTKLGTTAPFILSILFDYADNNSQIDQGWLCGIVAVSMIGRQIKGASYAIYSCYGLFSAHPVKE